MKEEKLNIEETLSAGSVSAAARLPYLRPEIDVQHVELEGAIAASVGASGTGPDVNPWDTDPGAGTGDSGDLSL